MNGICAIVGMAGVAAVMATATPSVQDQYCSPIPARNIRMIEVEEEKPDYTEDEIKLLEKLVMAEAGNQDLIGKRLVVSVVLNRMDDDRFPDTVEDVIYQKSQFSVVGSGALDKANPTEECELAVQMELGTRSDYDVIYFRTRTYSKYGTPAFVHQDHYFSK